MGAVLGTLGELGYGWAYRSLDAQYFGLAQRRERVFIVGCLGDAARAAQVLFEPASGGGNSPPRRETGQAVAGTLGGGTPGGGPRNGNDATTDLSPTIRSMNFDKSHVNGGGQLAVAFHLTQDPISADELTPALGRTEGSMGVLTQMAVRRLTPVECGPGRAVDR